MNLAKPETSAEATVRLFGAALSIACAAELYGLYGISQPTHWLANLQISVGDNSFRTLSAAGVCGLAVGTALYFRQGTYLLLGTALVTLGLVGNGKWFQLGASTSKNVQPIAITAVPTNAQAVQSRLTLEDTGAILTAEQRAWCNQDEDNDGKPNWQSSAIAKQNCTTGHVWQEMAQ